MKQRFQEELLENQRSKLLGPLLNAKKSRWMAEVGVPQIPDGTCRGIQEPLPQRPWCIGSQQSEGFRPWFCSWHAQEGTPRFFFGVKAWSCCVFNRFSDSRRLQALPRVKAGSSPWKCVMLRILFALQNLSLGSHLTLPIQETCAR